MTSALLKLMKNFSHQTYEESTNKLSNNQFKRHYDEALLIGLEPIFDAKWNPDDKEISHSLFFIVESYYRMPWRPDIAFIHLWQAINYFYSQLPGATEGMDGPSIENFINKLHSEDRAGIFALEKQYAELMPNGVIDFTSNMILKKLNGDTRKKCKDIYNKVTYYAQPIAKLIEIDFLEKYKCAPEDAYELKRAICKKIRILLSGNKVQERKDKNNDFYLSEKQISSFLFVVSVYQHRNSLIHGGKVPLLSSKTTYPEFLKKYQESAFIYHLTHFYLTVLMRLHGKISEEAFYKINNNNIEKLKAVFAINQKIRNVAA